MDHRFELVIGDKNYSSWSMRPWLLLHHLGTPFEEVPVRLRREGSRQDILTHSPSGKVPALKWNGTTVWDTLAIAELLAELFPDAGLWPADPVQRAHARAVSAEMHSGFAALRDQMPMDCISTIVCRDLALQTAHDIRRIVEVWMDRLDDASTDGFLFSRFCIADAMYAPVVSRFKTYAIDLSEFGDDGRCAEYCRTVLGNDAVKAWFEGARQEMADRT